MKSNTALSAVLLICLCLCLQGCLLTQRVLYGGEGSSSELVWRIPAAHFALAADIAMAPFVVFACAVWGKSITDMY